MKMKQFLAAAAALSRTRGPPGSCTPYTPASVTLHSPTAATASCPNYLSGLSHAGADPPREIVVCIGNQAADADSIISSLCLSYLRQQQQSIADASPTSSVGGRKVYVPVLPIPRDDLVLRRDVEVLLRHADISPSELVCIDEFDFGRADARLKFVLVDHNQLNADIYSLVRSVQGQHGVVEEIMDHHQDYGEHSEVSLENRNIAFDATTGLATVGSACTLVFESFYPYPELLTEEIAVLLMGVITLDTVNMDPAVAKGTSRDQAALEYLETRLHSADRTALFEELSNCKSDLSFWESLTASDAMRVDYKDFFSDGGGNRIKFGISAVLLPMVKFFEKPDLSVSIGKLLLTKSLQYFIIVTFCCNPLPQREVAVFCKKPTSLGDVHSFFVSNASDCGEQSSLSAWQFAFTAREDPIFHTKGSDDIVWKVFEQGNIKFSRKQLAPLLGKFWSK
jgi:exopolyphosphatase